MTNNDEFLKNMRVNVNPNEIEADDSPPAIAEADEQNTEVVSSGLISSLLDSKIENQLYKIENISDKILLLRDKIQRNLNKIDKYNAKIAKLEKQNTFLESIAKAYPKSAELINAKIQKNLKKIDELKNIKIPKRLDKIEKHDTKIHKLETKIERRQLKIKTYENIQNYFESFSISNAEQRHDNFISCLRSMNDSAIFKISNKINANSERLSLLHEKNQFLKRPDLQTDETTRSWVDKRIRVNDAKMQKLENRLQSLEDRLGRYLQLDIGMKGLDMLTQSERPQMIENVMAESKADFPKIPELFNEKVTSASLADRILTHNSEHIRNAVEVVNAKEKPTQTKVTEKTDDKISDKGVQKEKTSLLGKLKENEKLIKIQTQPPKIHEHNKVNAEMSL